MGGVGMERSEKEKSRYLEGIVAIILLTVAIYVIVIILKDPVAEPEIIMENELAEILWDNFDESKIKIIEGEAEMAHIETLYDDTMRNKDTEFLDYDGKKYITSDFLIEEGKVDLSRELFEMTISDKEENVICGYGIKTINEDYIIAIKYGDKYFKYINMSYIPDNLDDFFEIIGSKDNVEISYVEVLLGQDLKTVGKYVYQNNIDEWAWDLFDNRVHNTVEKGLVHHKHRVEQDFILRWGDVNI